MSTSAPAHSFPLTARSASRLLGFSQGGTQPRGEAGLLVARWGLTLVLCYSACFSVEALCPTPMFLCGLKHAHHYTYHHIPIPGLPDLQPLDLIHRPCLCGSPVGQPPGTRHGDTGTRDTDDREQKCPVAGMAG